jgi:hypothetical protein
VYPDRWKPFGYGRDDAPATAAEIENRIAGFERTSGTKERNLNIVARILSDSQEERGIEVLPDTKAQQRGRNYRFIERRRTEPDMVRHEKLKPQFCTIQPIVNGPGEPEKYRGHINTTPKPAS